MLPQVPEMRIPAYLNLVSAKLRVRVRELMLKHVLITFKGQSASADFKENSSTSSSSQNNKAESTRGLRFGLSLLSAFAYSSVRCSSSVGFCFALITSPLSTCPQLSFLKGQTGAWLQSLALDHYMFDPIR
jgi:hypothetical protein